MDYKLAYELSEKVEVVSWKRYGLSVVRDGYCPETGRRIHFVMESGYNGKILDDAYVFSLLR